MNEIKRPNSKVLMIAALFIILLWIICFIIRFTPLIQSYAVNLFTSLIIRNTGNLLFIVIPIFILYIIDRKNSRKKDS